MAFKLSDAIRAEIDSLVINLTAELTDLRDEYDDKSDTWKLGDDGVAADGWLDNLDRLIGDLEAVEHQPEGME
jgi:hypothetical protein